MRQLLTIVLLFPAGRVLRPVSSEDSAAGRHPSTFSCPGRALERKHDGARIARSLLARKGAAGGIAGAGRRCGDRRQVPSLPRAAQQYPLRQNGGMRLIDLDPGAEGVTCTVCHQISPDKFGGTAP